MLKFTDAIHLGLSGISKSKIEKICSKYYEYVQVFENTGRRGKLDREYPYRIHVRAGEINPNLLYELEQNGLKCSRGSTCNEWETSIIVSPNHEMKIHPDHMPVKLGELPNELFTLSPNWYNFLSRVEYLGHLMGTISADVHVPKQAFGECETSIVLDTYKRAYGKDYKSHQCNTCINFELAFKSSIVNHKFEQFSTQLKEFVQHFISSHEKEYETLINDPWVHSGGNNWYKTSFFKQDNIPRLH